MFKEHRGAKHSKVKQIFAKQKTEMQDFANHFQLQDDIKVSLAATKGDVRKQMEDKIQVADFRIGSKHFYGFLVCDGHCARTRNPETSAVGVVTRTLFEYLKLKLESNSRNIRQSIHETFVTMGQDVQKMDSGTTVSLLLIVTEPQHATQFWTANVGDSSIFGFREDISCKLSRDHKPALPSEMERMKGKQFTVDGDYVINDKGDQLAMTRAMGDCQFSHLITTEPTINQIQKKFNVFAIASDGVWDVMSGKDVWELVKNCPWQTSAAKVLDARNKSFEQHDNSALVLIFVK